MAKQYAGHKKSKLKHAYMHTYIHIWRESTHDL